MKRAEQYFLPGFSPDGKTSLHVSVSSNEQRAVGKQGTKEVVSDGWVGGWPGDVTRREATPEEIARLNRLSEASLKQLREDLQRIEEFYPSADGETLALTSD